MAKYLAALILLLASTAYADHDEVLRWTLTEPPTATGFKVHWALEGGTFTAIDTSRPVPVDGIFISTASVPDAPIYFYVSGYNEGGEGLGSNQICRFMTQPCLVVPPPPPPTPDPTTAEIKGFSLWNAQTDTKVMNQISTGNSFDPGCYTIEIRGNKYLKQNKGSVRKYLDGVAGACEKSYRFGWEDGPSDANWLCSASLNAIGLHTLKTDAYNNRTCTGAPAHTKEITFGVGVVPEPSFEAMLAVGVLLLVFLGRRRHAKRS